MASGLEGRTSLTVKSPSLQRFISHLQERSVVDKMPGEALAFAEEDVLGTDISESIFDLMVEESISKGYIDEAIVVHFESALILEEVGAPMACSPNLVVMWALGDEPVINVAALVDRVVLMRTLF
ncbi:hypothetical protein Nepgr_021507 [Nepenthes gracilis]|uniref:Uncharacterized protein n=1 Tax=Nepenthes gracilis TaxID=150966 RepID=A0AAD3XXF6_NEPGR|nr:hypothetical protein Nepgr_021507 [Nepenthes gracilis]